MRTFLYERHKQLDARLVDFHGWELPVQYSGIIAEHTQCREQVALFDTCHMGQFLLTGPDAGRDLAGVLTHDASALDVGRCKYGLLLNEDGGILDDTIVARLGDQEYLLVVNAVPADSDFEWIGSHLSTGTALTKQSTTWGKLDVQGPKSFDVLAGMVDFDLAALTYFHARRGRCNDGDAIISRTGYTGELGYEIFMPGDKLVDLFDRLLAIDGVAPAGLGARDLLRLEMCYPLYGEDISTETNPIEADMERFVSTDHEYVGVDAVRTALTDGVDRKLVAFLCDTRRRPGHGAEIRHDGDGVGEVTSGAFSPSLNVAVGMGYVLAEHAEPGTELVIATARAELPATVQQKPLYGNGTCRTRRLSTE